MGDFATELGDLLEREQELIAFDRLLSGDEDPRSGLLLIEGPPGIGKSRLIAELCERARIAGVKVLSAQGSDLEQEFPFGVVRQLFEPLLGCGSRT